MQKDISVKELPDIWNRKYKEYLGVDVPDDSKGVLQDVHWSHGSFGYFPTYSIGSFYAAQFFEQALHDIPDLRSDIRTGNLMNLKKWLNNNIHAHGRLYTADELCIKVTGKSLDLQYFLNYVQTKYEGLYERLGV